ncbi:hypothetical protein LEP1GSC048_3522 [Leptospira santarosai serovar Shermani str. 1342KT]|nr:hypothetical protein LEP1GSC040_3547 [Leptospira santarosai str. 2000030832]EPG82763.1 hypothetical protein LEP1GSC048_3522 [Leptospira santarosai serovar Shermani str. 1342KT]
MGRSIGRVWKLSETLPMGAFQVLIKEKTKITFLHNQSETNHIFPHKIIIKNVLNYSTNFIITI